MSVFPLKSDNGLFSIFCSDQSAVGCTTLDAAHLLLAAIAGPDLALGDGKTRRRDQSKGSSFLRQAVGTNSVMLEIDDLDPRHVLPIAIDIFSSEVLNSGMNRFVRFLFERGFLRLAPLFVNELSDSSPQPLLDPLSSPSQRQKYITLGSEFDCRYLDRFFR